MQWGDVATWVGAVATFLAVLVALRLHVKFVPPLLKLELVTRDGRPTPIALTSHKASDGAIVESTRLERARYYHVELRNDRPLFTATNPNVYILAVSVPNPTGDEFIDTWTGAIPAVAAYYGVHPSRTLGADPQLYDLCSVIRGKWVELHPQIHTMDFPKYWRYEDRIVRFRVTLQARSAEAVSPRYVFEIAWDGNWAEDATEMRKHMTVRPI